MAFALYIWGPAFGLPSIDAECIAAAAYVREVLPHEQLTLIIAHDPHASPTGDFPLLRHNSDSVGGFTAIVEYLEKQGYTLDSELSSRQKADGNAIRAHLTSNALPLLDATLYSSSSNYTSHTRPAWTKILPPYANFIIPPRRHAIAGSRTVALGLSSNTVDDLPGSDLSPQQQQEARMLSSTPSLIFKKRQTIQDAVKAHQSQTMFRLQSLTDAVMTPLTGILGKKKFMLTGEDTGPSSIDFLVFGYISLLLFPDLPNAWVADTIKNRFKGVAEYVQTMGKEFLPGYPFDADALMQTSLVEGQEEEKPPREITTLPWRLSRPSSPTSVLRALSYSLLSNFISPLQRCFIFESDLLTNSPSTALRNWTSPLTLLITLSVPVLATASYFLYAQIHMFPEQDKRFGRALPRLTSLGEAGAALSILGAGRSGQRGLNTGTHEPPRPPPTRPAPSQLYDAERQQRTDQDSPAFSDKPGVSVEVAVQGTPAESRAKTDEADDSVRN